jgi:hypothetical protein
MCVEYSSLPYTSFHQVSLKSFVVIFFCVVPSYFHLIVIVVYCNVKFISTLNEECYFLPFCSRMR